MAERYWTSVAWLVASAVAFSSAGVFVRVVALDASAVVWWRSLFSVVLLAFWTAWRGGVLRELRMRRVGVLAAVVSAAGTAAFIPAFLYTSVANVAVIYATAPFVAGAIAWVWLGAPPSTQLMVCGAVSVLGAALVVSGSLTSGGLFGDGLAFWMTVCMSVVMCIYRKWPNTPVAGPTWLASVLLVCVFAPWAFDDSVSLRAAALLVAFAAVFLFASVALMIGARGLHPAHTSMLGALETPLAPVLAWWVIGEVPALATALGGGIILVAVLYSIRGARVST